MTYGSTPSVELGVAEYCLLSLSGAFLMGAQVTSTVKGKIISLGYFQSNPSLGMCCQEKMY